MGQVLERPNKTWSFRGVLEETSRVVDFNILHACPTSSCRVFPPQPNATTAFEREIAGARTHCTDLWKWIRSNDVGVSIVEFWCVRRKPFLQFVQVSVHVLLVRFDVVRVVAGLVNCKFVDRAGAERAWSRKQCEKVVCFAPGHSGR